MASKLLCHRLKTHRDAVLYYSTDTVHFLSNTLLRPVEPFRVLIDRSAVTPPSPSPGEAGARLISYSTDSQDK